MIRTIKSLNVRYDALPEPWRMLGFMAPLAVLLVLPVIWPTLQVLTYAALVLIGLLRVVPMLTKH